VVGLALVAVGLGALARWSGAPAPSLSLPADPPPARQAGPVVIMAAGDIACDPRDTRFRSGAGTAQGCHMRATAELLTAREPDAVLALGDLQYGTGGMADYQVSFGPTWGRARAITRPVLGDDDYENADASGYFEYFGAAAGRSETGWYSFDLGSWHLIALNSNCSRVGGCAAGSPQERWLKADLAAHPNQCTLAFWHHPRFGSTAAGVDDSLLAFWRALHDAGAELVLNGHNHFYERLAPQAPSGRRDRTRGIRQFIVGTGGEQHHRPSAAAPNSEVRDHTTFGVLELTLRSDGYDWEFAPEAGGTFSDSGSGTCH
jgi:acid phosphatase type 7